MDEITTTADLFKLFAGEQNIADMRWLGEEIYFFVGRLDIGSGQVETYPCSITQSDLKDVVDIFTGSLRTLPTTEYLLLILWIREDKFKIDSLLEIDQLDFVQNAFALNGINIKPETVAWEFKELLRKEYISWGITEVEGYIGDGFTEVDQIKDYFLSPEGKRVAEEKFEAMKKLANTPIESPPTASGADSADTQGNSMSKQRPEPFNAKRDARILELRQGDDPMEFADICDKINREFPNQPLDVKAAIEALKRYCKRNNIPFPHGKRGRKSDLL